MFVKNKPTPGIKQRPYKSFYKWDYLFIYSNVFEQNLQNLSFWVHLKASEQIKLWVTNTVTSQVA